METAEEMYIDALSNDLAGWPKLLFPMSFLAKKSFGVIEKNMLVRGSNGEAKEQVLFSFMMLADTGDFNNNTNNSQNVSGQNENKQTNRSRRHWTAFALTSRSHIYYARWLPLSSDFGDLPVSSGDLNVNIDRNFMPLTSEMTLSTLRKEFLHLKQRYSSMEFIRNALIDTVDSIGKHKESEDGRRLYNQYANEISEADETIE